MKPDWLYAMPVVLVILLGGCQASVLDHMVWNNSRGYWYHPGGTFTISPGEQSADYYETGYFGLMSNIRYVFQEGYVDKYFVVFTYDNHWQSIHIYEAKLPVPDWEYWIVSHSVGIYGWNE
jgi:hypothetical protein